MELAKINYDQQEILNIRDEYDNMGIDTITSNDEYLQVSTLRKRAKKFKTTIEKIRKELISDSVAYQRAVNGQANEIKRQALEIEDPLNSIEQEWKNKVEAEKERIRKEKEALMQERVATLMSLDAIFNGLTYTKEDIVIHHAELFDMEQEMFDGYIVQLETIKFAEDAKIKEEEEKKEKVLKEAAIIIESKILETEDHPKDAAPTPSAAPDTKKIKRDKKFLKQKDADLDRVEILVQKINEYAIKEFNSDDIQAAFSFAHKDFIMSLNVILTANGREPVRNRI